jgi:hypothetical protein
VFCAAGEPEAAKGELDPFDSLESVGELRCPVRSACAGCSLPRPDQRQAMTSAANAPIIRATNTPTALRRLEPRFNSNPLVTTLRFLNSKIDEISRQSKRLDFCIPDMSHVASLAYDSLHAARKNSVAGHCRADREVAEFSAWLRS